MPRDGRDSARGHHRGCARPRARLDPQRARTHRAGHTSTGHTRGILYLAIVCFNACCRGTRDRRSSAMSGRLACIAFNTFREAVRDRVLYNLVLFALLMVGAAVLVGQISIGIERLVLTNLGLTAISLFGIMISVFLGIGLVSKEIDKRTLYT